MEPPRLLEAYQDTVDEALIRHRSVLDALSKSQEAHARLSRAIATAVTVCGCISIEAERQRIPENADLTHLHEYVRSHIGGELCARCREEVEVELGQVLFYETALASLFGLSLDAVLKRDLARLRTLGVFNLS
jgi:hypothetical protein